MYDILVLKGSLSVMKINKQQTEFYMSHIINTYSAGNLVSIFMGPNLAGKDYQAELLLDSGIKGRIISTGQLARDERDRCPLFREKYGSLMDAGDYLPDKVTLSLLQKEIPSVSENTGLVALVGNPRNKIQAGMLDNIVSRPNFCIGFLLEVEDSDVILGRAKKRHLEKKRVDDLDEKTVLKRFNLHKENKLATVKKLRAKGVRVIEIDGTQPPDVIHKLIAQKIKKHHQELFEQWLDKQPISKRRRLQINPLVA